MIPEPLSFQLLTCQVSIATDSTAVRTALRYLAQDAVQGISPTRHVRYQVAELDGRFHVLKDGAEITTVTRPDRVMRILYTSAHDVSHRSLPPHMRIHAGCATINGRRVLIVGDKRAGKTTLMLRLALDGIEVLGDETVVMEADGQSIPYPRRFHVRAKTFSLIPEISGREADFPSTALRQGRSIYAISPTELGLSWRLCRSSIDSIVFLERNHGGETSIHPINTETAMHRLGQNITYPERTIAWFTVLLGVVKHTRNYVLINGEPTAAASLLKGLPDQ